MTRRRVISSTLAVIGAGAAIVAPLASAAPASRNYPPPCPTQPLVWTNNGNFYVSVPDPSGKSCRTTFELPGNIKPPPTS